MKTIPKHLVTAFPRVRSNSVSSSRLYSSSTLSLFDSSAPPPSRPVLSSNRLYIESKPTEVEGSQNSQNHSYPQPPFSFALAQPHSSSGQSLAISNPQGQYALFPYSSLTYPAYGQQHTQQTIQDTDARPRPKRQRLKYQLDVGAYGIPKRCRAASSSRRHHSPAEDVRLSVKVGEDAYFVRDNAMGVADGVGGWSKSHLTQASSTPFALFARRLMHYCSAEVESCLTHSEKSAATEPYASALRQGSGSPLPPTRPQFSFTHQLRPQPSPATSAWKSSLSSSLPASFTFHSVFNHAVSSPPSQNNHNSHFTSTYSSKEYPAAERGDECFGTEQDLEDSLEELSEGIDVLQILERAYDKTLKAHVVSGFEPLNPRVSSAPLLCADAIVSAASLSESSTSITSESQGSREPKSLLEGSSTALLAVLDHPPRAKHVVSITTPAPISASSSAIPTNSSSSTPSQTNKSSSYPFSAPVASATTTNNTIKTLSSSLQETRIAQTPLKASTAPLGSRSTSIKSFTSSSGISTAASESSAPGIECEAVEEPSKQGDYDAVMKIAHVGDCMGMLVRGEEIVWRSEEMWWSVSSYILAYS